MNTPSARPKLFNTIRPRSVLILRNKPPRPVKVYGLTTPAIIREPTTPEEVYELTTPAIVREPTIPEELYGLTDPAIVREPTVPEEVYGLTTPAIVHEMATPEEVYGLTTPVPEIKIFAVSITMSAPTIQMPTPDSITAVGYKLADTRADLLVGQGQILKAGGENTSAILRDANGNALMTNANIDRSVLASMSQTDKYGLAQLNAANGVNDNVTRSGFAGIQATHQDTGKLGDQANTIAWNSVGMQDAGFAAVRAQNERLNDAQTAFSDRAAKYQSQNIGDSFARLSAQAENGFARELDATTQSTRQVVQSEMGVTRSLGDGFRDGSAAAAANYTSLTAQNCQTKEVVAAYGNRSSDQTASVLATLSAQHAGITRDVMSVTRELSTQAALNAAAGQLEAAKNAAAGQLEGAKNTAALQVQSALNAKDASDRAAAFAREAALQAALNVKESLLENSKWFALAEKTAMVNKCEIESKLAACCCEIKESVIGTANATQSLIQTNESSRVRDALSAAVAENSILRLRREEHRPVPYPLPYPYPHHHHHRSRSPSPRRG